MINIRRTARGQNLPSEASYRYSRGVHPSMAEKGLLLALELMQQLSDAKAASEIADQYPLPPKPAAPQPAAQPQAQAPPPPQPATAEPPKRLSRLEQLRLEKMKQSEDAGK